MCWRRFLLNSSKGRYSRAPCRLSFKSAYITPLLKKPDLDPAENKSYRPISHLSVLSKTLERLVAHHLLNYLYARRFWRTFFGR